MLQLFYSATVVEMTPVAQTNIEFYEIAHFLSKTSSYKKLQIAPEKKLQPLISAFKKKLIFWK